MHDGSQAAEQTDTSPRARARYLERLRAASPFEKLARTFELSDRARRAAFEALRRARPEASSDELRVEFVRRLYGEAIAQRFAKRLAAK